MSEQADFTAFIRRIRAGDEQAARELVERYEPVIRREVRLRMHDARLRRRFDSMDICQSVLGSFFVRAAAGDYDLDRPEQLLNLLVAMAQNKLAFQARFHLRQRRDPRRLDPDGPALLGEVATSDPSPSKQVALRELLGEFRQRLSDEERRLADLRCQGRGWDEIAAELGGTPDGRRMQLSRAADRVARRLGLDEVDDG